MFTIRYLNKHVFPHTCSVFLHECFDDGKEGNMYVGNIYVGRAVRAVINGRLLTLRGAKFD